MKTQNKLALAIALALTAGGLPTAAAQSAADFQDEEYYKRDGLDLINAAEAYARNNNLSDALSNLNKVRDRSLANPTTQSYTSTVLSTKAAMVKAILKERRIEFLMEGRRWADIHRLQNDDISPIDGIPAKIASGNPSSSSFTLGTPYTGPYGVAGLPSSDYRFLWPIPQMETAYSDVLAAQQNPGW